MSPCGQSRGRSIGASRLPDEREAVAESSAPSRRPELVAGVFLLLVTAAFLGLFAWRGALLYTSDQSMVILMAQDMRHLHGFPVFYEGVAYGGTLEPLLLAISFLVLPESVITFRVMMAALTIATVLVLWRAATRAFGRTAGLIAGMYLAVGPVFFVLRGLQSDGAYNSILLLGSLAVLLLFRLEDAARQKEPIGSKLALLAFALGMGWWVLPLIAAFAIPAAGSFFIGTWRRRLRPIHAPMVLAAFVLGGLPWWVVNVRNGFQSLFITEMNRSSLADALAKLPSLLNQGFTEITGIRAPWQPNPFAAAPVLAALLLVGAAVAGTWTALSPARPARERHAAAVLLLLLAGSPFLAIRMSRSDFSEARYLLPMYAALSPLVGLGIARCRAGVVRGIAIGFVALMTFLGHTQARTAWQTTLITCDAEPALRALDGFDRVYTSYWLAYKLTVASRGAVIGTPFIDGASRRAADQAAVDAARNPAFLLLGDAATRFGAWLDRHGTVGIRRPVLDGVVFGGLPDEVVNRIRDCRCIEPPEGER